MIIAKLSVFFLLYLTLFLPSLTFAQEVASESREPNVLVYYRSADTSPELKDSFNGFVSRSLFENGFNAVIIENETPLSELIDSALWLGAFFVLETQFSEEVFQVKAYSTWDGNLIAREEDTALNREDEEESNMLIPIISVLRQYLASAEVQSLMVEMEMDVQMPEPVETVPEKSISEADSEPQAEDETSSQVINKEKSVYHVSLETGPYLSIFDAAEYFPAAFYLSFHGAREIALPGATMDVGGILHYVGFQARGESLATENSLWSLGAEGRLRAGKEKHLTPVVRVSAGASYLVTREESLGVLGKFVPFVFAGVGTQYLMNEVLGLTFFIDCGLFSEESLLISGFIPSLGISYSF